MIRRASALARAAVAATPGRLGDKLLERYLVRDNDVIVVSFPKAGRTWLRLMVGRALAGHFDLLSRASAEQVLDVRPLADLDERVPRILFTHDGGPQGQTPEQIAGSSKNLYKDTKVVLLARDPRDVVVSLYFQKSRRREKQGGDTFTGTLADYVHNPVGGFDSILAWYDLWARSTSIPRDFLLVRYEDLHRDGARELARFLEFAGVHGVDPAELDDAVTHADFGNMRRMEEGGAIGGEALSPVVVGDTSSYKTRRGKVGGYRDELDAATVARLDAGVRQMAPMYGYR